jgi:hypothetical protein
VDRILKEVFYNLSSEVLVNRGNFHDLNSDLSATRDKKIK